MVEVKGGSCLPCRKRASSQRAESHQKKYDDLRKGNLNHFSQTIARYVVLQ